MAGLWWWLGTLLPAVPCPPAPRPTVASTARFGRELVRRPLANPPSDPGEPIRLRITRVYGIGSSGNRFAQVEADGRRVDVRQRTGRHGYGRDNESIFREAAERLGIPLERAYWPGRPKPKAPKARRPLSVSRRLPAGPLTQLRLFNPRRHAGRR